ncbi:MAG: NAD-dependent epimerase/dehydratase family protein [Verrucomicrobiota bacterium]|nr:NAD-dependent epimerase/dehydratase family protein [Verrucomicrobiota bacterium]
MPRILIAGCGYVGSAVAELFHAAGWEVEGWTASRESNTPYKIRAVDFADGDAVKGAASDFDVVVQCASSRGGDAEDYRRIYLEGARCLTSAFPQALFVFTSSTSVYAQTDGEWVTEESAANPERETGRILRETEELILSHGGIVARLAGIYGPQRSALLRKFLAGEAILERGRDRFINQAQRDDIAAALQLLVGNKARGVFNVSDNHPILLSECYEWLAAHLQKPLPLLAESTGERKRGNSNKRVTSEKLLALGWTPRYPTFQAAMIDSILPSFGL